jgi:hypothetical protein
MADETICATRDVVPSKTWSFAGTESCISWHTSPGRCPLLRGQEKLTSTYTFVDYTLVQRRPLDCTLLESSVVLLS